MPEWFAFIGLLAVFLIVALIFRGSEREKTAIQPRVKPAGPFTNEDLVTIASFLNPGVAHIVRTKLESEGIDAYLANDVIATIEFPQALIDGGVHVRVRESDVERARKILA